MPAAALNAFHTIYLRHLLRTAGVNDPDSYNMRVTNHPLPRTSEGQVSKGKFTCCLIV